jgi:hypothetical protein
LPSEYAKYKNRPWRFRRAAQSVDGRCVEKPGRLGNGNLAMSDDPSRPEMMTAATERKPLSPAAQRALAEAEARRKAAAASARPLPKELGGSKGPEPTRYGDWESKGIASDF